MTKETFKMVRETLGFSQSKFAEALGYTNFQPILRKEKGDSPVSRQDEIIIELKFADVLDIVKS